MSDEVKAAAAKGMWERQCRYDLIHHQMRVRDFQAKESLDWLERELLNTSLRIVAGEEQGSRSVDLSDNEYLAELDIFSADNEQDTK